MSGEAGTEAASGPVRGLSALANPIEARLTQARGQVEKLTPSLRP